MSSAKDVTDFARHALRAEHLRPAGIVNLVSLFAAFVLLLGLALLDIWQAIVRTWNSGYTSHAPSLVLMFAMYLVAMLLCVIIVGLLTRKQP